MHLKWETTAFFPEVLGMILECALRLAEDGIIAFLEWEIMAFLSRVRGFFYEGATASYSVALWCLWKNVRLARRRVARSVTSTRTAQRALLRSAFFAPPHGPPSSVTVLFLSIRSSI